MNYNRRIYLIIFKFTLQAIHVVNEYNLKV